MCLSKETVSSAGTGDGLQNERRISFHSSDRRSSRRLRKPSGMRTRLGSGGTEQQSGVRSRMASGGSDLPTVNSGLSLQRSLSMTVFLLKTISFYSDSLTVCVCLYVSPEPESFANVGDLIVSTRRKSVSRTLIFCNDPCRPVRVAPFVAAVYTYH